MKAGRPSRLKEFIQIAKNIVEEDSNAIIFTNEELLDEVNYEIIKKGGKPISKIAFYKWNTKQKIDSNETELLDEFVLIINKARRKQVKDLIAQIKADKSGWTRFAWILERREDKFNLRAKAEISGKDGKPLEVNITNFHKLNNDQLMGLIANNEYSVVASTTSEETPNTPAV